MSYLPDSFEVRSGPGVSGFWKDSEKAVTKKNYMDVEDLEVYKKLCQLHIEVCDLMHT